MVVEVTLTDQIQAILNYTIFKKMIIYGELLAHRYKERLRRISEEDGET